MLQRLKNFSANILTDYLFLPFWLIIFTLFRLSFILIFGGYATNSTSDILQVLFLGTRLSLKTSGFICLIGGAFASLPVLISARWPAETIRNICHYLMLIVFTLAFCARIPYYNIFQSGFNMMLLNVFYDDAHAMLTTAVTEYNLCSRVAVALALVAVLCLFLRFWQKFLQKFVSAISLSTPSAILLLVFLPVIWVFCRFGGAFSYEHGLNYFNAGRFPSTLLNEAVLDDGQALYRVYDIYTMQKKTQQLNFSVTDLRQKIATAHGLAEADSIDNAFTRTVMQPRLSAPPRTVFFILGENNAVWPFLPEYASLQLVPQQQQLLQSRHAIKVEKMLAHGSGTIFAVNGLLTGLPYTGIYENFRPETFRQPAYPSGIGSIMHQMGYKTVFWYGGFAEWQNLKAFALAQNFDEFHCADELAYAGGNAWGCPDFILLDAIAQYDASHPQDKVFHFILTTSNHPPYDIDLNAAGIDVNAWQGKLPAKIAETKNTLNELGHIRYMDEAIGRLVQATDRPDSLFIITGDHAERFSFASSPSSTEQSAIPCIIYSQSLDPRQTRSIPAGCHQQLPATLAELCAAPGFHYSSLLPDLWQGDVIFNHALTIKNNAIVPLAQADKPTLQYISCLREIAAWRILKGNNLTQ